MNTRDEVAAIESGIWPLTSFNARTMPLRQVVESFVPHEAFARLRRPVNTLLSGPRGSGKTTLMKMLQPMALELWKSETAIQASAEITYTGVFIPTDRTWKSQLEPKTALGNPFGPELHLVANAAFTLHVFRELIVAMQHRLSPSATGLVRRQRRELIGGNLAQVSSNLARLARLEQVEPTLEGVADALSIRMAELRGLQNALRDGRNFPIPSWIQIDCLAIVEAAVDIFNRACGDPDHQWALLFDEMELAPTAIVTSLLDAMRGQPGRLLLKLSLSPVQPELAVLHLPMSAVHGQDFELIQLNYARQRDALKFGTDYLAAELQRRKLPYRSKTGLLGRSLFSSADEGSGGLEREEGSARRKNPYAVNSPLWKRYKRLSEVDATFASWLSQNDVRLDELGRLTPTMRAAKLRKVRNIVVVREYYRGSGNRRRSRKSYELYTGADTIISFCDGNARLLTALIGQLLGGAGDSDGRALTAAFQGQAIDSIIRRFFALVYAAEAVPTRSGGVATLSELIHRLGEALASGVVDRPFSDNVPLSFTVDRRVSPEIIRLLHLGINVGAFVHIPRRPDYRVPLDLQGEQFRLTYVLAPYFGLPVRLGPSTPLSALLGRTSRVGRTAAKSVAVSRSAQSTLFDDVSLSESTPQSGD